MRAIVTGWKKLPPAAPVPTLRAARPVLAAALLAVLVAGCGRDPSLAVPASAAAQPARVLPPNTAYQKECGACHYAFNPGLLPASSWAAPDDEPS